MSVARTLPASPPVRILRGREMVWLPEYINDEGKRRPGVSPADLARAKAMVGTDPDSSGGVR
jgi:hypothetical protein